MDQNNRNKNGIELKVANGTKSKKEEEDDFDLDGLCVHDIIGEWGSFHRFALIIVTCLSFSAAFQNSGIIFYSDKTDFWCKKPEGYEVSHLPHVIE